VGVGHVPELGAHLGYEARVQASACGPGDTDDCRWSVLDADGGDVVRDPGADERYDTVERVGYGLKVGAAGEEPVGEEVVPGVAAGEVAGDGPDDEERIPDEVEHRGAGKFGLVDPGGCGPADPDAGCGSEWWTVVSETFLVGGANTAP
jgi:hypothetical protein